MILAKSDRVNDSPLNLMAASALVALVFPVVVAAAVPLVVGAVAPAVVAVAVAAAVAVLLWWLCGGRLWCRPQLKRAPARPRLRLAVVDVAARLLTKMMMKSLRLGAANGGGGKADDEYWPK